MADLYALAHSTCGHVGGVASRRAMLEDRIDRHEHFGFTGWVIRPATDADIASVVADVKCDVCNVMPGAKIRPV